MSAATGFRSDSKPFGLSGAYGTWQGVAPRPDIFLGFDPAPSVHELVTSLCGKAVSRKVVSAEQSSATGSAQQAFLDGPEAWASDRGTQRLDTAHGSEEGSLMLEATLRQLADLASDPSVGSLARLQSIALRSAADPIWATGLGDLIASPPPGQPLLAGKALVVSQAELQTLLADLFQITDAGDCKLMEAALEGAVDSLALVEASVCQDVGRLEAMAAGIGFDAARLSTIATLAALPLLLAVGRLAAGRPRFWSAGDCPVCGAWPTLAEVTGVGRRRALRCGRCGAGWSLRLGQCIFCGADDHRVIGHLAGEAIRESRQVETCERCHGYLKSISADKCAHPFALGLLDLATFELDTAALEHGYVRPAPLRILDTRVLIG